MNSSKDNLTKGILLILISAGLSCTGQLVWKLVVSNDAGMLYMLLGFVLYGLGGIAMIKGFGCGPLSVLHPMMSTGYILSLVLGAVVLHEHVGMTRIIGVFVIIIGLVVLSRSPETAGGATVTNTGGADKQVSETVAAEPDMSATNPSDNKEDLK